MTVADDIILAVWHKVAQQDFSHYVGNVEFKFIGV